jgi:hypothetical protein
MSQEAADVPVATRRAAESSPQAPMLVVRPDPVRGTVRVRGHLERLGAELLVAQLELLLRLGHHALTVQLAPTSTADPEVRAQLAELAGRWAADGVRLVVE